MLEMVASGEAALVVGTHAVIQEQVQFKNLALAIIDEQHRFGVAQRLACGKKAGGARHGTHMLMMSATPIPRTLAMSYYADWTCRSSTSCRQGAPHRHQADRRQPQGRR